MSKQAEQPTETVEFKYACPAHPTWSNPEPELGKLCKFPSNGEMFKDENLCSRPMNMPIPQRG